MVNTSLPRFFNLIDTYPLRVWSIMFVPQINLIFRKPMQEDHIVATGPYFWHKGWWFVTYNFLLNHLVINRLSFCNLSIRCKGHPLLIMTLLFFDLRQIHATLCHIPTPFEHYWKCSHWEYTISMWLCMDDGKLEGLWFSRI